MVPHAVTRCPNFSAPYSPQSHRTLSQRCGPTVTQMPAHVLTHTPPRRSLTLPQPFGPTQCGLLVPSSRLLWSRTATHTITTSGSHNVQVQSQVHTVTQVSPHVPQRYHTVAHSVSQLQASRSMGCCLPLSRTLSRSCRRTATGPSYTVAWSCTVPRVPPHTLPHGTPLLTGLLLRPRHSSLCAEADWAGPGARSRGDNRAHKGAAAELLRAGASGRWSPALDLSGAGHAGNAHQGAALRGQESLQDSVPSFQVFKSRTHFGCAGAACSGGLLLQGVEVGCSATHAQC